MFARTDVSNSGPVHFQSMKLISLSQSLGSANASLFAGIEGARDHRGAQTLQTVRRSRKRRENTVWERKE